MAIVIILYCLGNEKEKKSVRVQYRYIFFPSTSEPQLVKSTEAEQRANIHSINACYYSSD
jgi:hypothetical protein